MNKTISDIMQSTMKDKIILLFVLPGLFIITLAFLAIDVFNSIMQAVSAGK